jgi:hypothetical protein
VDGSSAPEQSEGRWTISYGAMVASTVNSDRLVDEFAIMHQ